MGHQPRILFLLLVDNQAACQTVAGLGRQGCGCALVSPPGFTCARSRYVSRHFQLPYYRGTWILGVRSGLERAVREWHPDLIVPLDDVAAWLLRGLATGRQVSAELRRVLETSLGSPAGYGATCSRADFMNLAKRIGVRVPESRAIDKTTALKAAGAIGYPIVLKAEQYSVGGGGGGVRIVNDPAQLKAAIVAASHGRWGSLRRSKEAARRLLWRVAGLRRTKTPFELQQFISGQGAMRAVVAWQGRVLSGVSFEKLCVNPQPFGPMTVFRAIDNPEMEASVRKVVAALGYSGFAHCDFVIEKDRRRAFMIEMNAHPPGSVHLGQRLGQDVCGALARQLGGVTETAETPVLPEQTPIVRFPFELLRDPDSAWLHSGSRVFHDVPWDDPPIFEIQYNLLLQQHPGHAAKISHLLGMEEHATQASL